MGKNKKSQINISDESITLIPKPEFRQGVTAVKYNQILVDKNKEVIERILETVKSSNSHAC